MVIRPYDLFFARSEKDKEQKPASENGKKNVMIPFALFEDFSRRINSDFSDILTIVEGYTQIALRKLKEGRLTEEHLQHILKTLQRGTGLTEEVGVFLAHLPETEEQCDLTQAVRFFEEILQEREVGTEGMPHLSLPEEPCLIQGSLERVAHVMAVFLPYVHGADGTLSDVSLSLEKRVLQDGREQAVLNMLCADDDAAVSEDMDTKLFYPAAIQVKGREDCLTRLYMAYVLVERMGGCICTAPGQGAHGGQRFQLLFPVVAPAA